MKGQLFSLPFIYLFGIIAAALILAFGFSAIQKLTKTVDEAALAKAVESLREKVDFYYTLEPGSKKQFKFDSSIRVSNKVNYACFVKSKSPITGQLPDQSLKPLIQNSNYNLYFLPLTSFKATRFLVKNLEPSINPLCIATKGSLSFTLETKATEDKVYVEITPIQNN